MRSLRDNRLGAAGAAALARALAANGGLTSLNLAQNQLCGIWTDWRGDKQGTYTTEGITAIADALRVNGALTSLDLSSNLLCGVANGRGTYTAKGIAAIADALRVNGVLTVANLLGNGLDEESAKMLAEVAKQKGISLCGIQRDQTTADFSNKNLKPPDAILLVSDLSQAGVTGVLTVTNLLGNGLDEESAKMLAEVAKQKGISLCGIQRDQTTADFSNKNLKPPDAILLASDLSQAGATGALTVTNLLCNELNADSAKMLAEVAKQKGVSLCGIQRDQTTADFFLQGLKPPDAILLASDLSQAGVTGGLTQIE